MCHTYVPSGTFVIAGKLLTYYVSLRGLGALCVPLPSYKQVSGPLRLPRVATAPALFMPPNFRESWMPETGFPRMSPLGRPVNGGSSPLNSSHKRYRYIDNFLSNQAKSAMEHIHDLRLPLCF